MKQEKSSYLKHPMVLCGKWTVVIAESRSPLAEVIEAIPCETEEGAWTEYRRLKKERGEGL